MERTYEISFAQIWNSSRYGRALSHLVAESLIKANAERDAETYNAALKLARRSK